MLQNQTVIDVEVIAKRVSKNMQEEQYQIIIMMYKPEA